ncbi:DUF4055 domain-containing protein [Pseudomonas sp.]|uniref:DUF4055 domain-containing protein n=1 Tax=Pseudomonas sp. TaxID=306 RepID=UPI001A0158D6|nr:DUF4055 domain-containing protein [Pseudomonas sp.]MBF0675580.1 DUF4055 domain-containing protein [Pseudomonas sp.]
MSDVTYQRPEYVASQARWRLVRDVCKGSEAVKEAKSDYLPRPNPHDQSKENAERYTNYLARAVFYNATGRTRDGLVGAVFRVVPTLTVPALLDYMKTDANGAGISIYQQSQMVLGDVLETGRSLVLVDFPAIESASRADMQRGVARATIGAYPAEAVINWRTSRVGARHMLSLVVLSETHEVEDGFGIKSQPQYRVLSLRDGVYTVEIWRQPDGGAFEVVEAYQPRRGNGQFWAEIPAFFVGAQNNDTSPDESPLYDLAEINIAHYRNSADYEDSAYLVGQPQVYMAGLDEQWVEMLEKKGIYFGSRAILPLPENGSAGILQAAPNTMCKEAMDAKERQMVALGARLVEKGSATKTATEAASDNAAEHSVLSLVASNVSEAYTKALQFAAEFMGAAGECLYELNQDFIEARLDPQTLAELVKSWQAGAITDADLWAQLRRFGLIDAEKSDDQIREELDASTSGLNLDDEVV